MRCSYRRYICLMKVGTRELKNRLSYYLRRVREDDEVVYVTDRGQVIAQLIAVPLKKATRGDRAALLRMAQRGEVTLGKGGRLPDFEPIKPKRPTSLSRYVLEDRR